MDVQAYLKRIGYDGDIRPSPAALLCLQEAHLLSVPFENLDIHAGKRIVLDPDVLFNKIVAMKRGGFCYELNGLFHRLLKELGFRVTLAMGRVHERDVYGPEFDHMLILADCQGETWVVDVGFGDFSMHPLKLVLDQPQADRNGQFIIEVHDDEYLRVSRFSPDKRKYLPEYIFSTRERSLPDFSAMCLFHQTSPESHFTRQKICSRATGTGRITLTDDRLIVTENGVRRELGISDEVEFANALSRYFNIVL